MIDHKAEAEKWIAGTDKSGATDPASINAAMARAQVHATLALAEQMRVQNLIAYKQMHTSRAMSVLANGDHVLEPLDVSGDDMTAEIERALGMTS